jgi:uncharacterized membrane protein YqjE
VSEHDPAGKPHPGFADTARALGASALELLRIRLDLLSVEWQEERERGKEVIVLAVAGALLLALGLLVLTLFVIVLFWDSWRLTAIAAVSLAYFGGGGWALLKVQRMLRNRPRPFEATLQEFAHDLQALRDHDAAPADSEGEAVHTQSTAQP